jgi:hypothetical protein
MSTVTPTPEAAPTTDRSLVISLFDQPGADIVHRSQDSNDTQVPKIYIVNSSPVLGELIRKLQTLPATRMAVYPYRWYCCQKAAKSFTAYLLSFFL